MLLESIASDYNLDYGYINILRFLDFPSYIDRYVPRFQDIDPTPIFFIQG